MSQELSDVCDSTSVLNGRLGFSYIDGGRVLFQKNRQRQQENLLKLLKCIKPRMKPL